MSGRDTRFQPSARAPKQATLNKWVNAEAVGRFADRLSAQASEAHLGARWPDDPTAADRAAAAAFRAAETAIRAGLDLAREAEALSREARKAARP